MIFMRIPRDNTLQKVQLFNISSSLSLTNNLFEVQIVVFQQHTPW
jgi:hypothetical protein